MNTYEVILTRRTIRQFKRKPVAQNILFKLVEAARCAPSAANRQPLEYVVIDDKALLENIYEQPILPNESSLKGYSVEKYFPAAYIIILVNKEIAVPKFACADAASATQNILLAAWSIGIGSCWLGSFNEKKIRSTFGIPLQYSIITLIAIGYPDESPIIEDYTGDSIAIYLDDKDQLHVPKRKLEKIMHLNCFNCHQ